MAIHKIDISKAGPSRIPLPVQAELAAGDTITFVAGKGADSVLCFEAHTLSILTPRPATANVDLSGGASLSFQVGAVTPGNYCVVLQAHGWPPPTNIDPGVGGATALLKLKKADGHDFPDPPDSGTGTRGG